MSASRRVCVPLWAVLCTGATSAISSFSIQSHSSISSYIADGDNKVDSQFVLFFLWRSTYWFVALLSCFPLTLTRLTLCAYITDLLSHRHQTSYKSTRCKRRWGENIGCDLVAPDAVCFLIFFPYEKIPENSKTTSKEKKEDAYTTLSRYRRPFIILTY